MESAPENPREPRRRVVLEGALGLRDTKRIHELLRGAMGAASAVELDVSNVSDMDISIIQLIVAARKSAEQDGRTLTLVTRPNNAFATMLVKAGFLGANGASRVANEEFWAGEPPAGEIAS